MPTAAPTTPTWCVIGRTSRGPDAGVIGEEHVTVVDLDAAGAEIARTDLAEVAVPEFVRDREAGHADRNPGADGEPGAVGREATHAAPRWVFSDTPRWYPSLLAAGVPIARAHDLRLTHAILARSELVTEPGAVRAAGEWDAVPVTAPIPTPGLGQAETLFEVTGGRGRPKKVPHDIDAALTEFARQLTALTTATDPGRLRLLLAAESAGGLVAAEMQAAGVPWDVAEHDRILTDLLGPRPTGASSGTASGWSSGLSTNPSSDAAKPSKMLAVAEEVRSALDDPQVNLDSPTRLLAALRNAGINVASTSKWELAQSEHPAIAPLLRYKKMARLLAANGWHWLDEWVEDGRYRPVYVPGGVVTGRWAASGGGALQIPRQLRPALRADPGWTLISADVAQLEPRALAAMSGDRAMAEAGAARDLYSGLVDEGIVATRQEAKIAVLGAMYGATTGEAGRLVPRLRTNFPHAMRLVDSAAEAGVAGGIVSTWLGRTSPPPSEGWRAVQKRANEVDATPADGNRARRAAGDQGRFTRNFVVQGTAAEWALAWLADLRLRLGRLEESTTPATASGPVFSRRAHLVFFLHDEVIVHAPEAHADAAVDAIRAAAASAGALLFGNAPVDFPLEVTIGRRAGKD